MRTHGFESVVVAGEANEVPPLLMRQTVIIGLSDGVVRYSPQAELSTASDSALDNRASDASDTFTSVDTDAERPGAGSLLSIRTQLQRIVKEVLSSDLGADQPLMEAGLDSIGDSSQNPSK